MRSGNSMTTCCVVNANMLNTLINLDNSKHCSRAIRRLSEGSFVTQYWLPGSPESIFVFSARQIARNQRLSKKFPTKKHVAIPMTRGRDKRLTMPKGFGAFMVNHCAVLWCGRNLRVATAHSNLPCFALCRKQHRTNKEPQNRIKMNLAQVTENKQQQTQVHVSTIYFYIHVYISTF